VKEKKMTALVKTKHEEVLGFNPTSKIKDVFKIMMTPYMAQYILDHLNYSNRKMVDGQIAAIRRSAAEVGWLWDGGACVFTTNGNIIEFQHRLKVIVERGETVEVIVVTGVDPEVFTQAAPAKNRTITDVVNKVDKSATSEEVTVLRQLIKRRAGQDAQAKGAPKLTMQNAVDQWNEWKTCIRSGMKLTSNFFNGEVTDYNPWERQFNAWAALMVNIGKGDLVKPFLDTFKQHKLKKANGAPFSSTLFAEFEEFLKEDAVIFLAGENKARMIHIMLCHATDRFELNKSGDVQFNLTVAKACHSGMISKGTYRDFLFNPQGLQDVNTI
jgi:hypothetical protein